MAESEPAVSKTLRKAALKLPGTSEGIACAGTSLETRTVLVGKKAFAFFGKGLLRLKLVESLPEAERVAKADPASCQVGAHGWIAVTLAHAPPTPLLRRWIEESHRCFAPKPGKGRTKGPAKS